MKLIVVALLVAAACVCGADEIEFSPKGLLEILKLKCERKSATAFQELKESFNAAALCFKHSDTGLDPDSDDFCEQFVSNQKVYECVTPVGPKLRACLEEEESFLPGFLYGAFNHTVQEFCKPEGRDKFKYLIGIFWHGEECLNHIDGELIGKTCFSELAIFKSANNLEGHTYIVKESEICSDMVNLQTCVINSIKEQCDGKDHSKFVHYLLEPYLSWCAQHQA